MVKDTRASKGPSSLRALNQPHLIGVKVDGDGLPFAVKLRGRWLTVDAITGRWRIEDEWWRELPIARMYHKVVLEEGRSITLFRDMTDGLWYRQQT